MTNISVHLDDLLELLNKRQRFRNAANVNFDIASLMKKYTDTEVEHEIRIGTRRADLYLPQFRLIVETKSYPLAKNPEAKAGEESPREQLEYYVRGLIKIELEELPLFDNSNSMREWTGIVTDGIHWHIWRFPHQDNAVREKVLTFLGSKDNVQDLKATLDNILSGEKVGRQWIPKQPANLFQDLAEDLKKIYATMTGTPKENTKTKFRLWMDMLTVSGMVPTENKRSQLFVTHTLLIAIARMISEHRHHSFQIPPWVSCLQNGFASWVLDSYQGKEWSGKLWEKIHQYDWRRRESDILRSLYESFVSVDDRKVFGEFYTPDWLAEMMVVEVLDDQWIEDAVGAAANAVKMPQKFSINGIGVLDPACGSGTFLIHAARRILLSDAIKNQDLATRSNIVAMLINGIDVHPVAVEIARANLMRLLPALPVGGSAAIRIHMGDSLMIKATKDTLFDLNKGLMRILTPQRREIFFPISFVRQDSFANDLRLVIQSAIGGAGNDSNVPPEVLLQLDSTEDQDALKRGYEILKETIQAEGNSVWTWYIVNIVAPHLLAERKVNRIVANPPWVKLADIQEVERKRTLETFGNELQLQMGGKQAPHLDIASFFVMRCRELYLAEPDQDPAIWLVKKSALNAGNWKLFRKEHQNILAQSLDLEQLQPFGWGDARRCCLLIDHRPLHTIDSSGAPRLKAQLKPVVGRRNKKPSAMDSWGVISPRLRIISAPGPLPQAPSAYWDSHQAPFRQGASIVPHVLLLVEQIQANLTNNEVQVITKRSKQGNWRNIPPQECTIPKYWLSLIYRSPNMASFVASFRSTHGILPIDDKKGTLLDDPVEHCSTWGLLNELYENYRGKGRNNPKTLQDCLNFRNKLSTQPLISEINTLQTMVLYPGSGDIMRAARTQPGSGVVDSGLYWRVVQSEAEAAYLTCLLNAHSLRRAFKECRHSGRHFQLHPWRNVPIPRYDPEIGLHNDLANLCSQSETIAKKTANSALQDNPNIQQVALSRKIFSALVSGGVMNQIDSIVAQLLPDQVD